MIGSYSLPYRVRSPLRILLLFRALSKLNFGAGRSTARNLARAFPVEIAQETRERRVNSSGARQLCPAFVVGRLALILNQAPGIETPGAAARLGSFLGAGAVVFWSFGAALVYLGAKEAGTWAFVALASLAGGGLQLVFRRAYHGELRSAICLPWRLWAIPLLCFVVYGLVWPWALVSASPKQVFGVSLINYLWPVLTVVFSVWWVPGVRLTMRTVAALLLAMAGLVCANLGNLRALLADSGGNGGGTMRYLLPYALAFAAAITWGMYSAFLVRWRAWARHYVTSPMGFLLIALIAAIVMSLTKTVPRHLSPQGAVLTLLYGAGPLAAGYLLWELALPRARVHTLSLIAAATPVLSTLLLCVFLQSAPGPELVVAALLVSGGVLLSVRE